MKKPMDDGDNSAFEPSNQLTPTAQDHGDDANVPAVTASAGTQSEKPGLPPGAPQHDGPIQGGMLPMVRIHGRLFVLENCLHFFPGNPTLRRGTQEPA